MPITAKEAQLTCVIEALRALDFDPPEALPETDYLLAEAREFLLEVYGELSAQGWPDQRAHTEAQRTEWLEFRMLEQQALGFR